MDGCDSLVLVELVEFETPILDIDLDICEGDTILIGNTPYTETGIFQEILQTNEACDSIVNLDLFTVICNITSADESIPVICHGEASGMILFEVTNGTPPFTYQWERLDGSLNGAGTINGVGEEVSLVDLSIGTYIITIEDNFDNNEIIIAEVTQPEPLELELIPSDYNGFQVSCFEGNDGVLNAVVTGGVPPYNFVWNNGGTTEQITQLLAGNYELTITDQSGCEVTENYILSQPLPLSLIADFEDPACEGLNTGMISVISTNGGVPPFSYSLGETEFIETLTFSDLSAGEYVLQAMDANGCLIDQVGLLMEPQIPEIELGDEIMLALGQRTVLKTSINDVNLIDINWTTTDSLDCDNCLDPTVFPINSGYYTLEVTSEDGCVDVDSVFVSVNKFRKFFAPNVFSPNLDGINDYFSIFGGPEVGLIKKLAIFDRWGGLRYEEKDILPGIPQLGWDGKSNGKSLNPGVFVWMAEIEFIDGAVFTYSGNLTLIR